MANDVIDSLRNMQLTTDEEKLIVVSDEERMEAIDSCDLSLIEKFLTCKPFNKRVVKATLRRAWGMDDSTQILEVGPNLFQFKFQSKFDMKHIFRGGPRTFDNQLLMLQ